MSFRFAVLLLAVWCALSQGDIVAQSIENRISGLSEERNAAMRASVIGSWETSIGGREIVLTLRRDGTYRTATQNGSWSFDSGQLVLTPVGEESLRYIVKVDGSVLTLEGGDLTAPMQLTERLAEDPPWVTLTRWVMGFDPALWVERLLKIGVVAVFVGICFIILGFLRRLSSIVVFGRWGPMRHVGEARRNQTRTIHLVILNVIKYVILLMAFGRILAEFGVNYTAYLASLSVIGLAIGFGSQGLVQDLVTGIFIILDNQFSVGDMVEISGQTGTVEEVGLRTTRLRNYVGQTVIIPNRNIALVGNFNKGALRAQIDIAMPNSSVAATLCEPLQTLCGELYRQFEGTILRRPEKPDILALESGETFLRLRVDLWPHQQGIVDAHLLPRLRDLCAREKVEIPAGRIAVIYRVPERLPAPRWKHFRIGDDD